jgi:secreted trypsin-like serine protease
MSTSLLRGRHRIGVLLIALLLFAMLGVAPTSAITNGEFDGNGHPFVGSMVIDLPGSNGDLLQACSGTLLEGGWFLTASHCLAPIEYWTTERFPGSEVKVTFDPTIDGSALLYSIDEYYVHPMYGLPAASDTHDVGLIKLATTPLITPASLPDEGLLDNLKDERLLKDTLFTTVGYGTVRETQQGAFASILDNVDRNVAVQGFHSLTKAWARLPMTPATGDGGTCYGDSGGPHFIWLEGEETDIVATITVTGDAPCKALDTTYRIDTGTTLEFLAETMGS